MIRPTDTCCICGSTRDLRETRLIDGVRRVACARCCVNASRLVGYLPTYTNTAPINLPATKRTA